MLSDVASHSSERLSGRPRDPAIDRAILEATLDVLRKNGYSGFSLEAVATGAGTTKPSILRRWPNRQHLIIAALVTVLVTPPVPDTGCTRCDLIVSLELLADALLRRVPPGVLAPLLADCSADPELRQHLTSALVQPARDAVAATVARAIDRGHLRPGLDADLVVDMLASVVFQGNMFGESRFPVDLAAHVVDVLLQGIAVDFDELVAISRATPKSHRHRHDT
ncbi:TetR/AcrR family transcriptional regulator [Streptomyces griseus]|uniref:TetR/AcrR family transcriptional regulator n=1 Tax=Streptomyces griseus TaxID=1911 RepID=UPI000561F4B7|nr:TetR/AcrR family transcriptional regulator [Streptomyces griseus]